MPHRSTIFAAVKTLLTSLALLVCVVTPLQAWALTASFLESIRHDEVALRIFLQGFPKGGELHTHLDGAVYAESYLRWAAEDGKCVDLNTVTITWPPCDTGAQVPPVATLVNDSGAMNTLIDAFSVRNFELRGISGHDQFFASFDRFSVAGKGRQGDMVAEVASRAAHQNTFYLEIMDSQGMRDARALVQTHPNLFTVHSSLAALITSPAMAQLVRDTIAFNDAAERRRRELLACDSASPDPGCDVTIRYLAQVIRVFPRAEIIAQTVLAYLLIEQDSRYVGLNFVAPEDAPITLRDYPQQMAIIRDVAAEFPALGQVVSLHAGELALPLVPPEQLRNHIAQAVYVAGARRIGHGIDIAHEDNATELVMYMAENNILVEMNLTSNAIILGVEGEAHPFAFYRSAGVPVALSTDDEGVARIDLTHEYIRAFKDYKLDYDELKELSRNALAYSFLPGPGLFSDVPRSKKVAECHRDRIGRPLSTACKAFLEASEKATLQWSLEQRLVDFESSHP